MGDPGSTLNPSNVPHRPPPNSQTNQPQQQQQQQLEQHPEDEGRRILSSLAQSGEVVLPWSTVRPVVTSRMASAVESFERSMSKANSPCVDMQARIARLVKSLEELDNAPFTIQRLCEIIAQPEVYFRTTDSFLFGLDKLCSVSSTISLPSSPQHIQQLEQAYAQFKNTVP